VNGNNPVAPMNIVEKVIAHPGDAVIDTTDKKQ